MSGEFIEFPKIARLSRECVVTEKIDGTNACVVIGEDGTFRAGSRSRWITPTDDNFGFAAWCDANKQALLALGPGTHFGEWWGAGIQRRYAQERKRFSLFNTHRWADESTRPACCDVAPILCQGIFSSLLVQDALNGLTEKGSAAAPGFMKPEGVIIWHVAARVYFKKTLDKDDEWKGKS